MSEPENTSSIPESNQSADSSEAISSQNGSKKSTTALSQTTESLNSLTGEWKKIFLKPTVTLAQLNELHEQLQQYRGSRVQLVGSEVERIDTAALQLLLAFVNHPEVTVGWVIPSPQLSMAAQLLGLSSCLGLPQYNPEPETPQQLNLDH